MLGWLLLLHVGLLGLALFVPTPSGVALPRTIQVDLVAAPAAPPAAKPTPRKAAPPPARSKKTVLPEKPRAAKPTAPPPAPKRQREVLLEPEVQEQRSLEEVLAEMRDEAGEVSPAPVLAAREPAAESGQAVSEEVLRWVRAVKRHVRRAWVVPRVSGGNRWRLT